MRPPVGEPALSIASALSQQLASDPAMEIRVWLMLAQRRESALLAQHERDATLERLPRVTSEGAPCHAAEDPIASGLRAAWAQEDEHAKRLEHWREALEQAPDASAFTGRLEGWVMMQTLSGGATSTAFVRWLKGAMTGEDPFPPAAAFSERCRFYQQLEADAADGYARLLLLLRDLGRARIERALGAAFGELVPKLIERELPRLVAEERFHAALWTQTRAWLDPPGDAFAPTLTVLGAVDRFHALATETLSLAAMDGGTTKSKHPVPDAQSELWISDGGLGPLFRRHGRPVLSLPRSMT